MLYALFGDRDGREVHEAQHREPECDERCALHADEPDCEAAENAREHERDAVHGADHAVCIRALVGLDHERDNGGERDVAKLLDDTADEDDARKEPEPHTAQIRERILRQQETHDGCETVGHGRDRR